MGKVEELLLGGWKLRGGECGLGGRGELGVLEEGRVSRRHGAAE